MIGFIRCKTASSKTRIETSLPEEVVIGISPVAKQLPAKQGLKQCIPVIIYAGCKSRCKTASSKTRIETEIFGSQSDCAIDSCKTASSKTRIETLRDSSEKSTFPEVAKQLPAKQGLKQ